MQNLTQAENIIRYPKGIQEYGILVLAIAGTKTLAKVAVKVWYWSANLFDVQLKQIEPTYIDSTIVLVDNTATFAVANGN